MPATETIARNLRRFRKERGFSLGELSRRSRLAKQTIAAIEKGQSNPTIDTIEHLADALDVGVRAMLSELGTEVLMHAGRNSRWQEQGVVEVRQLDQAFGSGYVVNAVLRLSADAGRFDCAPQGHASLRHCYVLEGTVCLGPTSNTVVATEGDFVRFPADTSHMFDPLTPHALVFVCTTAPQLSMAGGGRAF